MLVDVFMEPIFRTMYLSDLTLPVKISFLPEDKASSVRQTPKGNVNVSPPMTTSCIFQRGLEGGRGGA